MDWRLLFYALNGDGSETFIKGDVPIIGSSPIRKLSSPHQISGKLTRSVTDLVNADGSPVIKRWKTTAYVADENDRIWCGGIIVDYKIDGAELSLDVAGFTTALKGQPFDGVYTGRAIDPLDVVRLFWTHQQEKPGGNLGLVVDTTTSPTRIGAEADSEGVEHNWWTTADMGGVVDGYARDTPFDYVEEHIADGLGGIDHFLRIGYPTIGTRQPLLRFVLGENVRVIPSETYAGEDVVTEVWVFGAGEGRDRVRGVVSVHPQDSIRRVKQVHDKKIMSVEQATNKAREILMKYQPDIPGAGVTQLLVNNHSNAEFGTFDVGDEIIYSGEHQWGDVLIWVRIISMTLLDTGQIQLDVVRADTLTS